MQTPPAHYSTHEGDFYPLAYVLGFYGANQPAFLVLNFSPSPECTEFSHSILANDGKLLAYSRGSGVVDSPEYVMLQLWDREDVRLNAWHFFPERAIQDALFTNKDHRQAYQAARRRVADILWVARSRLLLPATVREQARLFHPTEAYFPKGNFEASDSAELEKYIMDEV